MQQIDQHDSQGRNDFLAPDKKIEFVGDFILVAAVGVGQPFFDAFQALPAVEHGIQIDMFIRLRAAVDILDPFADQFDSGRMPMALPANGASITALRN
ncbi:MAG: hypothetical protein P8X96_19990 [Desulfobacteraceae bacterium]